MFPYGTYNKYDSDSVIFDDIGTKEIWTISEKNEKKYSYEEAIDLTRNGSYNFSLLSVMALSVLAMATDMFSFSTVVELSRCDLQINLQKTAILMSVPFIGPIYMAYAWGYISDTQGRRYSLLIAMSCSFIMSVLCAFAPNSITLGVFKLIGTCFSSCAQSASYALLGESCSARVRGTYLIIMTSVIFFSLPMYIAFAYLINYLDFSFNLIFITFVPWRLLALILSLPLGISALSLIAFYESPKFLLNAGKTEEALDILRKIARRNGLRDSEYPIKKLFNRSSIKEQKDVRFLQSLWAQTAPLFKPPLLWKTLILYYSTIVIYSISSSIFVWLPLLEESFTNGSTGNESQGHGICSLIGTSNTSYDSTNVEDGTRCKSSSVSLPIVILSLIFATLYSVISIVIARMPSRKKLLSIVMMIVSALSSAGALIFSKNIINIILYFGIALSMLNVGLVSSYYVDLFPTSYLGMVSCLGVSVARLSSIIGVNWMGPLMMTQCTAIFSFWACFLLSAAVLSCFLPPDKTTLKDNTPNKEETGNHDSTATHS